MLVDWCDMIDLMYFFIFKWNDICVIIIIVWIVRESCLMVELKIIRG